MREIRIKKERRLKRQKRTRKKVESVAKRLRLTVFRSNRYFYAQIIDDRKAVTLLSVNEKEMENKEKMTSVQKAEELGKILAKKAHEKKIKEVVFDKGFYRYHGIVKAFAEGARSEGLNF